MRRFKILLICFLFLFCNIKTNVLAKETPPKVSADSVVLMDAATGNLLYAKNPDLAYPPASTTKVMTALLTLEKCKLDDVVKIGKNPPEADGSKIYLFEGEEIKVRDLLFGLMLASGNDCAEALAEHISGSMDKFAKEMNKRALELGCKNTNFVNPSGLYDDKHKTSAKDLALIMRELSKQPNYSNIATTVSYNIAPTNKSAVARPLWNENKLIQKSSKLYYEGCQGGKTGYTVQSLHSYVACATKNGQKLIVALIHDKEKTFFPDATALFNYGFNNFELVRLYSKGDLVNTYTNKDLNIPLLATSDFYYIKEKGKTTTETPKVTIKAENLSLKFFNKGEVISSANITLGNENLGSFDLQSGNEHKLKQVLQSSPFETANIKLEYLIPAVLGITVLLTFAIRKLIK